MSSTGAPRPRPPTHQRVFGPRIDTVFFAQQMRACQNRCTNKPTDVTEEAVCTRGGPNLTPTVPQGSIRVCPRFWVGERMVGGATRGFDHQRTIQQPRCLLACDPTLTIIPYAFRRMGRAHPTLNCVGDRGLLRGALGPKRGSGSTNGLVWRRPPSSPTSNQPVVVKSDQAIPQQPFFTACRCSAAG